MGLFDEITKIKRRNTLMEIGQGYAEIAQDFRGKYSAMLVAINQEGDYFKNINISASDDRQNQ